MRKIAKLFEFVRNSYDLTFFERRYIFFKCFRFSRNNYELVFRKQIFDYFNHNLCISSHRSRWTCIYGRYDKSSFHFFDKKYPNPPAANSDVFIIKSPTACLGFLTSKSGRDKNILYLPNKLLCCLKRFEFSFLEA